MSGVDIASRRCFLRSTLALAALPLPARSAGPTIPRVLCPAGFFQGLRTGNTLCFRGLRYGRAVRFSAAEPLPASRGIVDATGFGPVAPQSGTTYQPQSEDCLALNIWTPSTPTRDPRPVMVYIHGGAYSTGSVTDPLNDGARLAAYGDVVVVTVNHRLNAFGYLALARLDRRFPDSGNAGQLDLVLALEWIRRNISAFGGNPDNVTVFGQSGGGAKIATLMAMPSAAGLFHKAITMSGQQVTASGPLNATRRAETFLEHLAVEPVKATMQQLVSALTATDPILGGSLYFGPVLDDRNLPRHPFYPDAPAQSRSITLLLGNTIAETRAFFPTGHARLAGLDWNNLAARLGPELRLDISPERVVEAYRGWFPAYSAEQIFIAATTAGRSWRGQVIEAEARAQAGVPAFVYQLNFENAKHTDDIGLAFGTTADASPARATMSRELMNAFLQFARTGDPGWPPYTASERITMILDVDCHVERDPRGRERALFAQVPYTQPGT